MPPFRTHILSASLCQLGWRSCVGGSALCARADRRRAAGGADAWGSRGMGRRGDACIGRFGGGSWRALPSIRHRQYMGNT